MDNRWSEADAEAAVTRYTKQGVSFDLAMRTYSARLLGADPRLVLHGGGNTSVKTTLTNPLGEEVDVLCVKGSGWDMASIEPPGHPAVRLEPLRRLAALDALSDEEMVNAHRANLLDVTAPTPSVETLLHAFLPHKFVDHTHANAVLAITDQASGEAICRELYGPRMVLVPYVMPGFQLAKRAKELFEQSPDAIGMILLKHGIFTFGATARHAYERMIEMVTLAEERVAEAGRRTVAGVHLPRSVAGTARPRSFTPVKLPERLASITEVAPFLRGLCAIDRGDGAYKRWILEFRGGDTVVEFVNGADLGRYAQQGTATPDHVIRVKPKPLITPPPDRDNMDAFIAGARTALDAYIADYRAYFDRHNARQARPRKALDPMPRVILVPGVGLFGLGASPPAAKIAADLAEANIDVIRAAETVGRYTVIPEADVFDIEYWSLEQAKLGKAAEKPLEGRVCVVTGAASGIGAATARAFAKAGGVVAAIDVDADATRAIGREVGGLGLRCDVTKPADVAHAFAEIIEAHGGIDVVVSNAGAAWQGRIGDVAMETLRESFELNFWSHQAVAQAATRVMRRQGTGGVLLFNASKQAFNPGPDFGPYGLPKAALVALMRQYALDHGADGIRAAAVNADRIRSGLLTDTMVAKRARARGVSEQAYMRGNLLGREVTAEDVAEAFLALALAEKTTASVLTVDGGNIAAAPR